MNTTPEDDNNKDMDVNYNDNIIIDVNNNDNNNKEMNDAHEAVFNDHISNKKKKIYINIMKHQIIILCLVLSMCKMKY